MRSIKPFDLGWSGGFCVIHTPLVLHPSIKGSLMNSPPFSDCTLTICLPKVPLNGPKLGMRSIVLRSDFSLSGATHGISTPWVPL
eukprot:1043525-Prorocentrum_lima.AAC.1